MWKKPKLTLQLFKKTAYTILSSWRQHSLLNIPHAKLQSYILPGEEVVGQNIRLHQFSPTNKNYSWKTHVCSNLMVVSGCSGMLEKAEWLTIYVYFNLYVTSKVSYTWVISKGWSSLCKSIHISIWLICLWQINSCPVFCYSVSCFSRQFIGRSSHTCAGSEPPTDCWKQCLILITTWMEGTSSQMHRAFDDQV